MRRPVIGVVGTGRNAKPADCDEARELGKLIAGRDWVLLSGGTALGAMDAACQGAQESGGLVVGVIAQADDSKMSKYVDVPIFTGMMGGRNFINALSSDVMIACATMSTGTLSEIAHALRFGKQVVLLSHEADTRDFLQRLGGQQMHLVDSPAAAVAEVERLLAMDHSIAADQITA
jgi:uncharacterized protein (TIGR00725 family)